MKLKIFKTFLNYIQSICDNYVSARTKYINTIEKLSQILYNSEPGIIAKNLLSSTSQDVWLQLDSVAQLDALILRDAFDVDFIINDTFSISSQLTRGIYVEDYRIKTQRVEMKRLEKRRKENIKDLFNGHYLKKATQEYRKFFDTYEISFRVREDVVSYYKNYFLKFVEYISKYYSAEIKEIEKEFFYENEKGEIVYLSAPTIIYVAYSVLKKGLISVAEEKFAGRINFIKNKSIQQMILPIAGNKCLYRGQIHSALHSAIISDSVMPMNPRLSGVQHTGKRVVRHDIDGAMFGCQFHHSTFSGKRVKIFVFFRLKNSG